MRLRWNPEMIIIFYMLEYTYIMAMIIKIPLHETYRPTFVYLLRACGEKKTERHLQ